MDELASYVAAWSDGCTDLDELLGELDPEGWDLPTDCPGWNVRDVIAHLLSIEHALNTGEQPDGIIPIESRSLAAWWTEAGVAQHRGRDHEEVLALWRKAVAARRAQLAAEPPSDPTAPAPRTPGGVPWDNRTLLRNRVVDVWVHEQDIRRATARPGGMTSAAAAIVEAVFAEALPYVVGKRAGAAAGTRVRLLVGGAPRDVVVGEGGRAGWSAGDGEPDVTVTLDREALTVFGAGRRQPDELPATAYATVEGDTALGEAILRGWAVTP